MLLAEKLTKLAEALGKSPQLRLKDLQKFVDTMSMHIDDAFDLDLFGMWY